MKKDVVEVTIKGVMPTSNGCAVFLGNQEKTFVIYVDSGIGNAISLARNNIKKERPLTHDLIGSIFLGLGVELKRVVVNDVSNGTFYARIILEMSNEVSSKIIELDARPSDSIILALQHKQPIYVARDVLDEMEDMSEVLERIIKQQEEESDEP